MSIHLVRKLRLRDHTLSDESVALLTSSLLAPEVRMAGETIVEQGSRPSHSTLLVAGWVSRFAMLADGRRQTLALHMSGDFVDLHSFPVKLMDHGVEALTDCVIARLPHASLRKMSEVDPHLTRMLWLQTLIDAAILRQWLLSSGKRSSLEHAALLLCELFTRLEVVGLATAGKDFDLPLTQAELGDALGITAIHMNRTIVELRTRKLFTWTKGRAQILDWEGLAALAEFDPTYLCLNDEPR